MIKLAKDLAIGDEYIQDEKRYRVYKVELANEEVFMTCERIQPPSENVGDRIVVCGVINQSEEMFIEE